MPPDIFLYAGEAQPNDVRLADPTVVRGGTQTFTYVASGGIVFGGAAVLKKTKVFRATGGIVFAGAALYAKVKRFIASGGIVFGGAAVLKKTKATAGSGGAVFGGAALTSYVPATIQAPREPAPQGGGKAKARRPFKVLHVPSTPFKMWHRVNGTIRWASVRASGAIRIANPVVGRGRWEIAPCGRPVVARWGAMRGSVRGTVDNTVPALIRREEAEFVALLDD
ncbi:MAG: hypothetical protein ACREI9_13225 [Nitrospiraceae bacterium]